MTGLYVLLGGMSLIMWTIAALDYWTRRHDRRTGRRTAKHTS